jgi:aminodeoxyfutalosine synthase
MPDFETPEIGHIADKVFNGIRITENDALLLYEKAGSASLSWMADFVKTRKHGRNVYYLRNIHIEPTNICIYNCLFCAYSRKAGENGSWEHSMEKMMEMLVNAPEDIAEIHITGGTHPDRTLDDYAGLLKNIRMLRPKVFLKAFSAAELHYVFKKAGLPPAAGISKLKDAGLDALPGGGAEIFDPEIREKICPAKANANEWLGIHRAAHQAGLQSGSTMLYGHIESYKHRVEHMALLRNLQDETSGFSAFIPLKYKKGNNRMCLNSEVSLNEDLRNYAVSRIFLDNIPHIKAYWPMLGRENASLALHFGADDLDGTIDDSTKIYSMTGSAENKPQLSRDDMICLIREEGFEPTERKPKS